MSTNEEMTIILPVDMVCLLKAWIITGQYASESEAIIEGLKALAEHKGVENRAIKKMFRDNYSPDQ